MSSTSFIRNIATLMTGTVLAQMISFLCQPILSRLYTPTEWGQYAIFNNLIMFFATMSCLKYELAIMQPKNREDGFRLVYLGIYISGIVCLGIAVIFSSWFLSAQTILPIDRFPVYWLIGLPLHIFLIGLYQIFTIWLSRENKFTSIATARTIYAIISNLIMIGIALYLSGKDGIFWGMLIGQFFYTFWLVWAAWRSDLPRINLPKTNTLHQLARDYAIFPRVTLWQYFMEMLQVNALFFLIPLFFSDPNLMGYYSKTAAILQLPVAVIGAAMAQVVYQRATQFHQANKPLKPFLQKIMTQSVFISVAMCLVLWAAAPMLFAWFFGAGWRESGVYAQLLVLGVAADFVRVPLSQTAIVKGKQTALLQRSFIGTTFYILSFAGTYFLTHDIYTCFIALTFTMLIWSIYLVHWLINV